MTDLEGVIKDRDQLTKQLGDVVRQFSLGGLGIIWILKSEPEKTGIAVGAGSLLAPLSFFLLSLFFDLIQYSWSAGVWDTIVWIWSRRKNPKSPDDSMPKWFEWLNIPTRIFMWVKAVCVVVGYLLLICIVIFR